MTWLALIASAIILAMTGAVVIVTLFPRAVDRAIDSALGDSDG